jgi:hypothetical protein
MLSSGSCSHCNEEVFEPFGGAIYSAGVVAGHACHVWVISNDGSLCRACDS